MQTFTRWINGHLDQKDKSLHIDELEDGLKSGVALHTLLGIVSGDTLRKCNPKAKMPVQYIENINTCLKFIQQKGIKLVGIGAEGLSSSAFGLANLCQTFTMVEPCWFWV